MLPPMLCTDELGLVDVDPSGWLWQVKLDGFRAQLHVGPGAPARLWSRQGRRLDGAFPDVIAATTVLEESAVVLDCELVVLDERGHPDFAALSGRAHARTGSSLRRATDAAPAVLAAFDVLMVRAGPAGARTRAAPRAPWRVGLVRTALPRPVGGGRRARGR